MNRLERFANTLTNHLWGLSAPRVSREQLSIWRERAKIVAHRGCHGDDAAGFGGALENSRESFDLALKHGLWGIEFDVRFTRDDIPVIHHDAHCRRVYQRSEVIDEIDHATLSRILPQIPSLKEVVERYGRHLHLLIEIKEPLNERRHRHLAEILEPLHPRGHYHLLTLRPEQLKELTFAPKSAVMVVDWMDMENTLQKALTLGYGAISGHFLLLNDRRLRICRELGLTTGTGFIETQGALYREISRGIDLIFSNFPLRLKGFLS